LLFRICVYGLMPWLQQIGMPEFWTFMISYGLPLVLLMLFTVIGLKQEGNLSHWRARLRLNALTFKRVMLCIAIFIASFLLTGLLVPTAKYLASIELLSPPDFLPDILDPNKTIPGRQIMSFMGIPLKGAYWVVLVYFIFLTCFNILGEELWFRGYILPRQERQWGNKAWIYHGLFLGLFHFPIYPWTILYLLPTTWAVSYVSQKFNSTWAGFIIHYLGNGVLALLPIIMGVGG
jgi:membrane protease YdiL (CAAX protease family)